MVFFFNLFVKVLSPISSPHCFMPCFKIKELWALEKKILKVFTIYEYVCSSHLGHVTKIIFTNMSICPLFSRRLYKNGFDWPSDFRDVCNSNPKKWRHQFFRRLRAANSVVSSLIWRKFELIQGLMHVLVT